MRSWPGEALAIREKAGLKSFVAESQAALAALALEQHQPLEAEALARLAALEFIEEQQADNEAWAQALLAESLALQEKRDGAMQALARAKIQAEKHQNTAVRLLVRRKEAVLGLSLDKRSDSIPQAERVLSEALTEANASGLVVEALALRLAQYQILPLKNYNKETVDNIHKIASEATGKGLRLIAKKSNELIAVWQQGLAQVK